MGIRHPRSADSFDGLEQLGARLRELRVKAGLKQADLARLMGRNNKGGQAMVSRVERGDVRDLAFRLVADYLRAVRQPLAAITGIVDPYTAQPTVVEKQGDRKVRRLAELLPPVPARRVRNYDIATTQARVQAGVQPEPVDERIERVRKLAASWLIRQQLEDCVHFELNKLGIRRADGRRFWLADYGRRVFKALAKSRGKKRARRPALLEAVEATRVSQELDRGEREQVRAAVERLFDTMEQNGALDKLPTVPEARKLEALTRGRRVKDDKQLCLEENRKKFYAYQQARNEALKTIQQAYAEESGLGPDKAAYWNGGILAFFTIGLGTEPASVERARRVEQFITSGSFPGPTPDQLRALAQFVFAHLDPVRSTIPPDPSR